VSVNSIAALADYLSEKDPQMLDTHQVIANHYPKVANSHLFNKPISKILKYLFCEEQLNEFSNRYPHLTGFDFVEQVLSYLSFTYRVNDQQRERIPQTGKLIIIANHPIGTLDGLVLIKCVKETRSDIKVIANNMLMAIQPLHEILLPVSNMQGRTQKQNILNINLHLRNEGALIVFPAGEVSRLRPNGIRDTTWQSGFLRMAKVNHCPILPVYLDAKNSVFFYGVSMLYKPAASALLVKEMFNKKNHNMDITIGEVIPPDAFAQLPISMLEQVKLFKKHIYNIAKNKAGVFPTQKPIAMPEERRELLKALKTQCEVLGEEVDGKTIYLYRYTTSSPIMRELGRLREMTFRAVGEGTNQRRDIDKYDKSYYHLILWDKNDLEIAGAYRFGDVKKLLENGESVYSTTLFDYTQNMQAYFEQGLELGRSFVQQKYWGKRSLEYLWIGIGAFLAKHPQYRYLFGPVTLSAQMPDAAVKLITAFYTYYFPDNESVATAKTPYPICCAATENFTHLEYKEAMVWLKSALKHMNVSLPTLYKQYAEVCENGGVKFVAFNIDPDFQNCIDGLVIVDTNMLKQKKRKRYFNC
jgi:putative hemolysin